MDANTQPTQPTRARRAKPQTPPTLPPEGLAGLPAVLFAVGLQKSRWYAGVKSGEFPAGVHIGRRHLWPASEIRALIERLTGGA